MIRQKDIAALILIVSVVLVVSYLAGNAIINSPKNRSAEVEVVTPIDPDFPSPDPKIFNSESINPTEIIRIGGNKTDKPFEDE